MSVAKSRSAGEDVVPPMRTYICRIAAKLLFSGVYFRYLRLTGKPLKPAAVSLEITHDCISRCIMCNIWKIPREVPNLAVDVWLDLLSSNLFANLVELDITGGEPFLRDDLPQFFDGLRALRPAHLPKLQSVAITTNGFLTARVLEFTERILSSCQQANLDLVVVCAMDAVGDLHDRIRNVDGAWSKVNRTVQGLKRLRDDFSNLIIGLKTTIVPSNVDELDKIVHYAGRNDLFTIISPCIITAGRYLNPDRTRDLSFDEEHLAGMIRFFETDACQWSYHAQHLIRFFQTGCMKKPCSCGFNYFFVRSNGELFLCPLIEAGIGNISEAPVEELYHSKQGRSVRRRIGKFTECRRCTEPGLERYSLPCEGFAYLRLLVKMKKTKFLELHRHMGLDKYVN